MSPKGSQKAQRGSASSQQPPAAAAQPPAPAPEETIDVDNIDDEEEEPAKAAPEPVVAKPGEVAAAIADAYREDFHLEKDVKEEDVVGAFASQDKAASKLQAAVRGRSARKEKPLLAVGACVEARFGGDDEWFPGKIDGVNEDGTYAVANDDGDEATITNIIIITDIIVSGIIIFIGCCITILIQFQFLTLIILC